MTTRGTQSSGSPSTVAARVVGDAVADHPHPGNFCGGNFRDWLDVNLTDACNGSCSWCVERQGWHPEYHAPWGAIVEAAIATGKRNIILLGGEPLLHPDLGKIIPGLADEGRRVWVTTNGSHLTAAYVQANMVGVFGVNISIHHHDLRRNRAITGLSLDVHVLELAIAELGYTHTQVRLNCNCIVGQIDSVPEIRRYTAFAEELGADSVRFAELKGDDEHFVDLAAVWDRQHGLNDDPFVRGCHQDAVIDCMPVSFRQMCGMQTNLRPCPEAPQCHNEKSVLYYDGRVYDGWQTQTPEGTAMNKVEVETIVENVKSGKLSVESATRMLLSLGEVAERDAECKPAPSGGFCRY